MLRQVLVFLKIIKKEGIYLKNILKRMAKQTKKIDFGLLAITFTILICGVISLTSASSYLGEQQFDDPFFFLKRQLINLGIGLIFFLIALNIDLKKFKKYYFYLFLLNFIALFFVFIPGLKVSSGSSTRWFAIGGISVQPSEFLKLSIILYLGHWLSSNKRNNKLVRKKGKSVILSFFLFIICLIGTALYIQSDLSTLILILLVCGIMLFSSKFPFWYFLLFCLVIVLMGVTFSYLSDYRLGRIQTFLNPGADPLGEGYQIQEAKIAIGSGQLTGVGLGMSQQRFGRLPQPISDSIFAIIAEETGFIGAIIIIALFLLFTLRGFTITKEVSDQFYELVSIGITSWIFLQAAINIASISALIPLTGIPLPLISYGGSALISELIAIGVLINISKEA
jgi:cell division protein FtsW